MCETAKGKVVTINSDDVFTTVIFPQHKQNQTKKILSQPSMFVLRSVAATARSSGGVRHFSKYFNTDIMACHRSPDLESLVLRTDANEFNAINVSTAIHRLGKLRKAEDYAYPRNQDAITKLFALAKHSTIHPQTLSNIMLGIANGRLTGSGHRFPEFIYQQLERHQHFLRDFSPQALTSVFFSFAIMNQNLPSEMVRFYLRELEKRDVRKFHDLDFPQLLWALATQRLHCPAVYAKLATELNQHRKMGDFSVLSLSNMLWSFAEMGHPCKELGERIAVCLTKEKCLQQSDHKFVIRIMWSLACLDMLDNEHVQAFFQTQPPVYVEKSPQTARFYLQTRLAWQQTHEEDKPSALLTMLDSALTGTQAEWADKLVQTRQKLWCARALHILDFFENKFTGADAPVKRYRVENGVYVDMCFPSRKLVIQLENPYYYTENGEVVLGSTLFFQRLIKRAGYKLVVINLKSFERDYTPQQQGEMLVNLAKQIKSME